jgi:hypothetical protein
MTDVLTLAARLRALDDAHLRRVIEARGIRSSGIDDVFDLAEALSTPAAVQQALTRLDRPTLAAIADPDAASREALAAAAAELLVIGDPARPFDAVAERLAAWSAEGLPADFTGDAPVFPPHADPPADALAAERAFQAAAAVADLAFELGREPARELAKGGIAQPELRRLAMQTGVELDAVARFAVLAADAGLVASGEGTLAATDAAEGFLTAAPPERWRVLAAAWLDLVPPGIRPLLAAHPTDDWTAGLPAAATWLFPAAGDRLARDVADLLAAAELLGITADGAPSSAGALLVIDGAETASASWRFPASGDRVYLLPDLTVVSPGPLEPALDARLRLLADVETRGLAPTYRVSGPSLVRALAAGEDADDLRGFLETISLTGLPQPLEYLLGETAERFGSIRVGPGATGERRTRIMVDSPQVADQLLVDQAIGALRLARDDGALVSRLEPDVVFWSLADARYPVAAVDAFGAPMRLRRAPPRRPPVTRATDHAAVILERLRAAEAEPEHESGVAYIARQLDAAVRGKTLVTVAVELPGGRLVELTLEPASVAGGRLRGRDRAADVERTLPLSSIRSVAPGA